MPTDNHPPPACAPGALPAYARAWHPGVQRADPASLPTNYDTRIAPEDIFALPPADGGGAPPLLVVLQKCEKCTREKQFCSRARPRCARCERYGGGAECTYGAMKWTALPRGGKPVKWAKERGASLDKAAKQDSAAPPSPPPEIKLVPRPAAWRKPPREPRVAYQVAEWQEEFHPKFRRKGKGRWLYVQRAAEEEPARARPAKRRRIEGEGDTSGES